MGRDDRPYFPRSCGDAGAFAERTEVTVSQAAVKVTRDRGKLLGIAIVVLLLGHASPAPPYEEANPQRRRSSNRQTRRRTNPICRHCRSRTTGRLFPTWAGRFRFAPRDIGESAVAVVVVENTFSVAGDEDVFVAVSVVVANGHAFAEEIGVENRPGRHIGESAVPVIAIKRLGG